MNNVIVPLANHNTGKVRGLQGMNGTWCFRKQKFLRHHDGLWSESKVSRPKLNNVLSKNVFALLNKIKIVVIQSTLRCLIRLNGSLYVWVQIYSKKDSKVDHIDETLLDFMLGSFCIISTINGIYKRIQLCSFVLSFEAKLDESM